jgi:hypothetical protein
MFILTSVAKPVFSNRNKVQTILPPKKKCLEKFPDFEKDFCFDIKMSLVCSWEYLSIEAGQFSFVSRKFRSDKK